MARRYPSHRLLDRLSIYLPVILLGMLAMGSYWLLRATPALSPSLPNLPPSHEVDYFMRQFKVQNFEASGLLRSELMGQEIRHFPDLDTLEVDLVRMHSYSKDGHLTTITARRALSNGDGSEVQFFGATRVLREGYTEADGSTMPRLELKSEFLHAIMDSEQILTPLPVVLTRGDDRFTADAMEYDNVNRVINLHGHVVAVIVPKPAR